MFGLCGVPASVGCVQIGHGSFGAPPLPPLPPCPPAPAPAPPAPVPVLVLALPPPPAPLDELEVVVWGPSSSLQASAIDATQKMEKARACTFYFFGIRLSGGL